MKTISISLFDRLKGVLYFFRSGGESLPNNNLAIDKGNTKKEKIDLALLQRKAYCGNFFLGPYVLFHPDLFE